MIRNALAAGGAFFALFLVFNILAQGEKTFLAWTKYREFVAASCLPSRTGERAFAEIRNGKLECEVRGNVGHGRGQFVVSAAVLEIPD